MQNFLMGLTNKLSLIMTICAAQMVCANPIPVTIQKNEHGWQLLRNGQPYLIKGAGGDASMERLAAAGANSIRTWSVENAEELLDSAHKLGLSVTLGIWMGHERHGFDYSDVEQVSQQFEKARQAVLKYKDHPALLIWAVGNEAEGFERGDNELIWRAINDVAAMIQQLDPHHPVMTVTADVGGDRVKYVHEYCDAVDIHGINSYGGAQSLKHRLSNKVVKKPYVLTEFGPLGPWESPKTKWGAPFEPTSTEKAQFYRTSYEKAVVEAEGQALGSYVFLWGHKMEATATWFGLFLEDDSRVEGAHAMQELWTAEDLPLFEPQVSALQIDGSLERNPEEQVNASITIVGDKEQLTASWELRPDSDEYITGGDFRREIPAIANALVRGSLTEAEIKLPKTPGHYRLFYTVRDGAGNAATANSPIWVKGERRVQFPVYVYQDGFEVMPWVPSGWMGHIDNLTVDGNNQQQVKEGEASIRIRYEGTYGWAGVAWQNPPNNWGDKQGGFDLTGASYLELWARGAYGGESISIGVGLITSEKPYHDSVVRKHGDIELGDQWQKLIIPLENADLSHIVTGFVVTLVGRQSPVTIYLDEIRFVD